MPQSHTVFPMIQAVPLYGIFAPTIDLLWRRISLYEHSFCARIRFPEERRIPVGAERTRRFLSPYSVDPGAPIDHPTLAGFLVSVIRNQLGDDPCRWQLFLHYDGGTVGWLEFEQWADEQLD
jgi:hypothetical protein